MPRTAKRPATPASAPTSNGAASSAVSLPNTALVAIDTIREHPRNYRDHPDDQIAHLVHSLREYGVYRNLVLSADGVLLAGHGVLRAARHLGLTQIPAVRLPFDADDPRALKVLIGDNEVAHLVMNDDRQLTEMLRELWQADPLNLLGTGYDETMLAALAMVTRPTSEIRDTNEAAHWVGMPEYGDPDAHPQLMVHFRTAADREQFAALVGLALGAGATARHTVTAWWPPKEDEDPSSLQFQG